MFRALRDWLNSTRAEIPLVAVIGASAAFSLAYFHESNRAENFRLGFSEISQIESDAGAELGPLNQYLPKLNDTVMGVLESYNDSHGSLPEKTYATESEGWMADKRKRFARELQKRMDPTLRKHHYELKDLIPELPAIAQRVLDDTFWKGVKVRNDLGSIVQSFDNAWNYDYHDNTHTNCTTRTTLDADGNPHTSTSCTTTCDSRDHTFTYNSSAGEAGYRYLERLLGEVDTLALKERIKLPSKTHEENEMAMRASRSNEKEIPSSPEDYLEIARNWWYGSTIYGNQPITQTRYENLRGLHPEWGKAKGTAHTVHETTFFCNEIAGPPEYQIASHILENGKQLSQNLSQMIEGIEYVRGAMPILDGKIRDLIKAELSAEAEEGTKLEGKKLEREITDIVTECYSKNFKGGFDLNKFRAYMLFIATLVGAAVGAGAGFALDQMGDKYGIWGKTPRQIDRY